MRRSLVLTISATAGLLASAALLSPASALTLKECSAKYKAAQADGSAKGVRWNDFRKAECGKDAVAGADASADAGKATAKAAMSAPSGVTFPKAIAAKYASESPAKARMHTCVDEYHANKTANTLGGLHWIQKGGGYYSMCSARLRASS